MKDISLRDARPAEFPEIVRMIGEFRLDYENLSPEQFIVAEQGGRMVGFGRLKPYPDCVELGCVGVVPEARSLGIGKILVRELVRRCRERGLSEVWITTDLRGYFEPMGFVPVDEAEATASIREKLGRFTGTVRPRITAMRMRL